MARVGAGEGVARDHATACRGSHHSGSPSHLGDRAGREVLEGHVDRDRPLGGDPAADAWTKCISGAGLHLEAPLVCPAPVQLATHGDGRPAAAATLFLPAASFPLAA